MNNLKMSLFESKLKEAVDYATSNNLDIDEICDILKNKIRELSLDKVLWRGTYGTCSWEITEEGVLKIFPRDGKFGKFESFDPYNICATPWKKYSDKILKIVVKKGVATYEDASFLFYEMSNCREMDLRGLDVSNAVDMYGMFSGCTNLEWVEVGPTFKTAKVENAKHMFYGCDKLKNRLELETYFIKKENIWTPQKKKKNDGDWRERDIKPR